MKKRTFIVAALAMVALVGCQKDLMPESAFDKAEGSDLAQRPVVGNVILTVGDETRATVNTNGYSWKEEVGDKVGAMLVDEVDGEKAKGIDGFLKGDLVTNKATWKYADYAVGKKYEITNKNGVKNDYLFTETYVSNANNAVKHSGQEFYKITPDFVYSNYPYVYDESAKGYTTPASLVEGHYVFYAPYSERTGARGPVVVTLPIKQDVSKTSKAVEDFYKGENPVMLAAAYVAADGTKKVSATLSSVFAYPQFTIKNEFEGYLFDGTKKVGTSGKNEFFVSTDEPKQYDMKLIQMEIYLEKDANNLLAYKRALDPQALYDAMSAKTVAEQWNNDKNEYLTLNTAAVFENRNKEYDVLDGEFSKAESAEVEFENDMMLAVANAKQRIVLDFGGKEVKFGDSYKFFAIMPAEDYTEAGLTARILVEIDGTQYYIMTNEVDEDGKYVAGADDAEDIVSVGTEKTYWPNYGYFSAKTGLTDVTDYKFVDRVGRNENVPVLVRGQRYPNGEVYSNKEFGTGLKDFAGELLTVNLVGGMHQVGVAKKGEVAEPEDKGIYDNDDFLDYIKKVTSTGGLKQDQSLEVSDPANGKFVLADPNEVIINAALIKALANIQKNASITFTDNLPIAADVAVSTTAKANEFTFATADGDTFTVIYDETEFAKFNTNAKALTNGINVITSCDETDGLKAAEANAATETPATTNAVVILNGNGYVKTATGIIGIVVAKSQTLKVDTVLPAWITAKEATVEILKDANITNALNEVQTVENTGKAAFTTKNKPKTVNFTCFNLNLTSEIPASSKINKLTVQPEAPTTAATPIKFNQANVAKFAATAAANGLTVMFGSNATHVESDGDVTMKDVNIDATSAVTWTTTMGEKIYIYVKGFTNKFTSTTSVEFKK